MERVSSEKQYSKKRAYYFINGAVWHIIGILNPVHLLTHRIWSVNIKMTNIFEELCVSI